MEDKELKMLVNSCIKKHRYNSKKAALDAINRIHKKRNTELRIYFCSLCLGYHLTSKVLKENTDAKNYISKTN